MTISRNQSVHPALSLLATPVRDDKTCTPQTLVMMPMKLSTRRIVVCGAPEIVASVRLLSEAARTTTRNGGMSGSRPYVHAQLGNPCTPIQHGSSIGNHYEPS